MARPTIIAVTAAALALLLASCGPAPRPAGAPTAAPAPALAPPAAGARRYEVAASHVTVRVHRDGPLARLGHNHVISSTALGGTIELATPRAATRFALVLPLDSLAVDLPEERAVAGPDFAAPVPEADRAATRRNMLGERLLDAERQPTVTLATLGVEGGPEEWHARVRIGIAGGSHDVTVPVRVDFVGEELVAQGTAELDHAALGLTPFSVALGALRVRPDLQFAFSLRARPAGP